MYIYIVYYCILIVFCIIGLRVFHGLMNINHSINQSISLNITPNFHLRVHFVSLLVPFFIILHSLHITLHSFSSAVVPFIYFTVQLSSCCPLSFSRLTDSLCDIPSVVLSPLSDSSSSSIIFHFTSSNYHHSLPLYLTYIHTLASI